jgi:hypothetical protein
MKKKVVQLTESEIISLVKQVIQEQIESKLRRRSGEIQDLVKMFINSEDPSNFNDEFEYADNILYGVYDDLIERYPDLDKYDEEIMDYLKETYGHQLFDLWYEATSEENDEDEDEF